MLVDVKTHSCVDIVISNYKFRISVMGSGSKTKVDNTQTGVDSRFFMRLRKFKVINEPET